MNCVYCGKTSGVYDEHTACVESALAEAAEKAVSFQQGRDDLIRETHAVDGMSIRAIAKAAGLSSARVHQIIHGR